MTNLTVLLIIYATMLVLFFMFRICCVEFLKRNFPK
jgi:hypothetical protein